MKLTLVNILAIIAAIMAGSIVEVQSSIVLMPEALYPNSSSAGRVENFILQHRRQYEDQIKTLDKQLEDSRRRFDMRLDVIEYYDAIVDIKLRDVEDKWNPMEILGDISDYCVKKYRGKIPAEGVLKANLNTCINKANQAFNPVLNNAENTLKIIKNHYNNQFANTMKDCKRKFEKSESKYQNCVSTAMQSTTNLFTTNTNIFQNQMSIADCSANTKINDAFDCYSNHVYQTFTAIGEVNGLIENCLIGQDFCMSCDNEDLNAVKGRCPYQMAWHLADDDLTDEKIVNPFKGINSTTPCLQINFVTKNFYPNSN